MGPKRDLYDLIHSLTEGETNRLARYLPSQKKKLFEAIASQDQFDESALKESIKEDIYPDHLPTYKRQLYYQILEILTRNRPKQEKVSKLHQLLPQIKILIGKSLYAQAETLLGKAKTLAASLELFSTQLDLIQLERELWIHYRPLSEHRKALQESFSIEKSILDKQSNLLRIRAWYDEVIAALSLGYHEKMMVLEKVAKDLPDSVDPFCRSQRAKITYYRLRLMLTKTEADFAGMDNLFIQATEACEDAPDLLGDPAIFLVYIKFIFNRALALYHRNLLTEAQGLIEMLREVQKKYAKVADSSVSIQERIWNLEILMATKTGNEKRGLKVIGEFEHGLKEYAGKLNNSIVLTLQFNSACFLIYCGKPQKALKWIAQIRGIGDLNEKPGIILYSWLLYFFAKFDSKAQDEIFDALAPTKRFFRKHGFHQTVQERLLSFFRKTSSIGSKEEIKSELLSLKEVMTPLLAKPENQIFADYFPVQLWIESHLEKVPLLELIKKSYQA